MFKDRVFLLIRRLLLYPYACPPKNLFPKSDPAWISFISILRADRLVSFLYHFNTCKRCKRFISSKIAVSIDNSYYLGLLDSLKYKNLKDKINSFLKKKSHLTLVLLKDNDYDNIRKYYPRFYFQQKYDIDLWGNEADIGNILRMTSYLGYKGHQLKLQQKYLIDQYEFKNINYNLPDIEFRYQILTSRRFKNILIITNDMRREINREYKNNIVLSRGKLSYLNTNWTFIIRFLIFYFDDACQGMKHLHDLWLLATKKGINWPYIFSVMDKFKLTNTFIFTIQLSWTVFGNPQYHIPQQAMNPSFSVKLALVLFRSYSHLYKPLTPSSEIFFNRFAWRGYIFSLITGLLWQTSFINKIRIFLRPKTIISIFIFVPLSVWKLLRR